MEMKREILFHFISKIKDMELFNKKETREYFQEIHKKIENEIECFNDQAILSADIDAWAKYYTNNYAILPISIYEESISSSIQKEKVEKSNPFAGSCGEPNYFLLDGTKVLYKIPFWGDSFLLFLHPMTFMLRRFNVEAFKESGSEEAGEFTISLTYSNQELKEMKDQMQEYVKKSFRKEFDDFKQMIESVNGEVNTFNSNLYSFSCEQLKKRKEKADSYEFICNSLQIPLSFNENAPDISPLPIKLVPRPMLQKPHIDSKEKEYCISAADYENINKVIWTACSTMEKTAKTYRNDCEEELRDHVIACLNTFYQNANGETFRKTGKTDILIEFENKAAFIGECKIWHGEKVLDEALKQVLGYATWRDTKLSLIIFNKVVKDFNVIRDKILTWAKGNMVSVSEKHGNEWNCKLRYENRDIQLTILAFDLCL